MTGEIFVLNSIAIDAAKYLMDNKKRELDRKFPPFFMHLTDLSLTEGERIAERIRENLKAIGASSAYCAEMSEGGILNALWYMAETCETGFEIRLRSIPIDQQTVEILEFFDINPYYARSQGTWVALTENPIALERILSASEIPYKIIGHANDLKARTILNGESVRYLDRPQREDLEKVML